MSSPTPTPFSPRRHVSPLNSIIESSLGQASNPPQHVSYSATTPIIQTTPFRPQSPQPQHHQQHRHQSQPAFLRDQLPQQYSQQQLSSSSSSSSSSQHTISPPEDRHRRQSTPPRQPAVVRHQMESDDSLQSSMLPVPQLRQQLHRSPPHQHDFSPRPPPRQAIRSHERQSPPLPPTTPLRTSPNVSQQQSISSPVTPQNPRETFAAYASRLTRDFEQALYTAASAAADASQPASNRHSSPIHTTSHFNMAQNPLSPLDYHDSVSSNSSSSSGFSESFIPPHDHTQDNHLVRGHHFQPNESLSDHNSEYISAHTRQNTHSLQTNHSVKHQSRRELHQLPNPHLNIHGVAVHSADDVYFPTQQESIFDIYPPPIHSGVKQQRHKPVPSVSRNLPSHYPSQPSHQAQPHQFPHQSAPQSNQSSSRISATNAPTQPPYFPPMPGFSSPPEIFPTKPPALPPRPRQADVFQHSSVPAASTARVGESLHAQPAPPQFSSHGGAFQQTYHQSHPQRDDLSNVHSETSSQRSGKSVIFNLGDNIVHRYDSSSNPSPDDTLRHSRERYGEEYDSVTPKQPPQQKLQFTHQHQHHHRQQPRQQEQEPSIQPLDHKSTLPQNNSNNQVRFARFDPIGSPPPIDRVFITQGPSLHSFHLDDDDVDSRPPKHPHNPLPSSIQSSATAPATASTPATVSSRSHQPTPVFTIPLSDNDSNHNINNAAPNSFTIAQNPLFQLPNSTTATSLTVQRSSALHSHHLLAGEHAFRVLWHAASRSLPPTGASNRQYSQPLPDDQPQLSSPPPSSSPSSHLNPAAPSSAPSQRHQPTQPAPVPISSPSLFSPPTPAASLPFYILPAIPAFPDPKSVLFSSPIIFPFPYLSVQRHTCQPDALMSTISPASNSPQSASAPAPIVLRRLHITISQRGGTICDQSRFRAALVQVLLTTSPETLQKLPISTRDLLYPELRQSRQIPSRSYLFPICPCFACRPVIVWKHVSTFPAVPSYSTENHHSQQQSSPTDHYHSADHLSTPPLHPTAVAFHSSPISQRTAVTFQLDCAIPLSLYGTQQHARAHGNGIDAAAGPKFRPCTEHRTLGPLLMFSHLLLTDSTYFPSSLHHSLQRALINAGSLTPPKITMTLHEYIAATDQELFDWNNSQ